MVESLVTRQLRMAIRTRVPFESFVLRPHSSNTEQRVSKRQVAFGVRLGQPK